MKLYEVTIDGYKVGRVELTNEEVKAMLSDGGIILKEVK